MAFDISKFGKWQGSGNQITQVYRYKSTADSLATVTASAYFNKIADATESGLILAIGDEMKIEASDGGGLFRVTAISPNVTVETSSLEDGSVTNAKVAANAAIDWSKMGALTEGSILLGSVANVATVTDAKTDTQILVGDGTTVASVAMSGDATLANTGALTIGAGAVSQAKIIPASLSGTVSAPVADANVIGGTPELFRINTAGGATADTDVVMTYKTRVIDAWVVNNAAGTASDTITIKNGANAITDAIDISPGDTTIARVGTIDDAQHEIAASGTLKITETDGGGSDSPATTVYVLAVRVA